MGMNDLETNFIVQIIGTINAWACRHGYDNDDTLKKVGGWLSAYTSIATCENYRPTIASIIRSMSDEELAQMMIDIAYENTPIDGGDNYMRIPSPLGGYLIDGLIDLHDTDVVVDALQEEVPNEGN